MNMDMHMEHTGESHSCEHCDRAGAHGGQSGHSHNVEDGTQSATVVVKGGYSPSTIQAKADQPVRLVFDRQEEGDCSSHVVFKELGVDQALPAFQKTELDLGVLKPGEYPFACGMNMLHGVLKVS